MNNSSLIAFIRYDLKNCYCPWVALIQGKYTYLLYIIEKMNIYF